MDLSDDLLPATEITVGGVTLCVSTPGADLVFHREAGIIAAAPVSAQVVYRTSSPTVPLFETRCTVTPSGDFLLMFPEGGHYGQARHKVNDLLACRSGDGGRTWSTPQIAFTIDYNQHGFIPLIPRGTRRIYAFGTQPVWDQFTVEHGQGENAPIGYRWSDDDGHTWSDVVLISPENDPAFRGMSVMRMCETETGTWLLGSHAADWSVKPLQTRQYILRSEDQGQSWHLLPGPRPYGWYEPKHNRMDELRPLSMGGAEVLALARTCAGTLWQLRSQDDGRTWSEPAPTPLVHPDAPPMACRLPADGRLVVLHHNRHSGGHFNHRDRSEVWLSTSGDGGHTWSEPRFLCANALAEAFGKPFRDHQCSYIDIFPHGDTLHMFMPHRWRQVLHLTLPIDAIMHLPTRAELAG
jgi:hypothetical protein